MEGTHGKLRARLADGLCGNDTYGLTDIHGPACSQVRPVALGANAILAAAGEHAAALHALDARGQNAVADIIGNELVALDDDPAPLRIDHPLRRIAAQQPVAQRLHHLIPFQDLGDGHALGDFAAVLVAILFPDDDILGNVDQAAGKVTRVRRAQRRIRKALARAVGGDEELEHREAFAEVRPDGHLDDLARRIRHQAAHARQLADLVGAAARAGVCHHVDGVIFIQRFHQGAGHVVRGLFPNVDHVPPALRIGK